MMIAFTVDQDIKPCTASSRPRRGSSSRPSSNSDLTQRMRDRGVLGERAKRARRVAPLAPPSRSRRRVWVACSRWRRRWRPSPAASDTGAAVSWAASRRRSQDHQSARLTSRLKPSSENAAPELLTVFCTTSSLPCCTSTSVTASESTSRLETATRCTRGLVACSLDQRFVVDAHRLRHQGDAERGLQQGRHENLPFRPYRT